MEELTFYIVIAMLLLFFSILGTAFMFLAYSGLFHKVEVGAGQPPMQEVVVAYHFGRGAYRNCGYYYCELNSLAPTMKTLGIYYDDPQQVEEERLRWAVACIVANESEKPNEKLLETLQEKGYKLTTLPHVTSVVRTKFPNSTFLSFFLAIYKVYPALAKYIQEHKLCAHPFIEIYDGSEIHFMVPLARQSEFYVPESLIEDEEEDEDSDEARMDISSDDGTPEKMAIEKVVDSQPTSTGMLPSIASSSAAAATAESAVMRDSFDRDTPVEEAAKAKQAESAPSTTVVQASASEAHSQHGSPSSEGGPTPEGGSSSEVDSESYEVVKTEDVSEQN